MKKPKVYRRLASGHHFGFASGGWVSLHLAPDHLLLRSSAAFAEQYRRFYFTDIEAITICKTVRGILWNAILGLGLFFSLLPILLNRGPHIVAGSFVGAFGLLLLMNILRGATCQTHLQTRVQKRALPLRRVRKALRVVNQLTATINEAQVEIASTLPRRSENADSSSPSVGTLPAVAPPPLPSQAEMAGTSWLHLAMIGLLLLSGAAAIWDAWQHQVAIMYVAFAGLGANLAVAIWALVRQRRKVVPMAMGPIAWVSVIAHAVAVPIVYTIYTYIHAIGLAQRGNPKVFQTVQLSLSELRGLPAFEHVFMIYGAFCILLAAAGSILLVAEGGRTQRAQI